MRVDLIIVILLIILIICVFKNDFINISGISKTNEPFFDEKTEIINSISEKLNISERRIIDLEYGFIPEGSDNLVVKFSILPKNSLEMNEPTINELQATINHLFETNTFIIKLNNKLIKLESNSGVSFTNNTDSFNNTSNYNSNSSDSSNVKPTEEFGNYYCDVDPTFDNISILKAKNIVESVYRNFPHDDSLTRFIELENKNGKIRYLNSPRTCMN